MTAITDIATASQEAAGLKPDRPQGPPLDLDDEPNSGTNRVAGAIFVFVPMLGALGGRPGVAVAIFVCVPMLALLAAIPVAWVWGFLDWQTALVAVAFYLLSGLGIAMGFHRYFTHGSFQAHRGLNVAPGG